MKKRHVIFAATILLTGHLCYANNFSKLLQQRRSIRSFNPHRTLSAKQIKQLLWAGQGITSTRGFRTAPSAGALYPIELYVVAKNGVWHYSAKHNKLDLIIKTDLRTKLIQKATRQMYLKDTAVIIAITADYKRTAVKYKHRPVRYADIEVGAVMQNILLQAVALKLAAVPIGGISEPAVRKLLKLPVDYTPLLLIPIGYSTTN